MGTNYIETPSFTTLADIVQNNYSLSATQYKSLQIKNKNIHPLSSFLDRELTQTDLGSEVGGECYIEHSPFRFIKTKALQEESYLLDITDESAPYVTPQNFKDMNLKAGDILISKDCNVGEAVILDKDYPNTMLCSGIYRLPITKNKYYVLAFIKSALFKQQIDFLVPKGSTIRHGKTKFLDCMIPLPNQNAEETIQYIELLVQAIINKEIEIKRKFQKAMQLIQEELEKHQAKNTFSYTFPTYNELMNTGRLDSGLYSRDFKEKEFLINNYLYGTASIQELDFEFVRGNNLAESVIGKSIYSDVPHDGFYVLVLPTNISRYGTISKKEYLGSKKRLLTLQKGSIIFGAEGTFRSTIFMSEEKAITNFHGLTIHNKNNDIQKSIFVKLMLDYFREKNICRSCATGGNGGSLSKEYWKYLRFPNFPDEKEKEIVKMYANPDITFVASSCDMSTFSKYNANFDSMAGIYDLDIAIQYLKAKLNEATENISCCSHCSPLAILGMV